jgi:serine/threonine-protein kinase
MEASESLLRTGFWLDRYELVCPIASGGMATVWVAKLRGKRGFEKLFAIKTIRTELAVDTRFEEMFLDEARIASGIQHPNVAQILDLGEQDGVLFIVMEWVDGDSLAKIRKLIGRRQVKIPVGISLRILADASAGLHAAHELRDDAGETLGIVHRDVSPQNILVAASGAVKVIDFGIAKARKRQQGETRTGIVKGKVQYMAPEQVKKGGVVDRRADVWALGMCLHELVAGDVPYGGEDDVGVIRRLMSDEPPSIEPTLPPPIARLLERSIAFDPDARFPTAAGMQRALEGAMKELGEVATGEDIAAYLRAELPELALKRREAVGKAIESARGRAKTPTESRDDVAFAPTIVSDRDGRIAGRSEARPMPLTKRKAEGSTSEPKIRGSALAEDSHVTGTATLEQEPVRIPKRSFGWLWAILILVGAAVGAGVGVSEEWPAATRQVLTMLGLSGPTSPPVEQQPPPSTPPAPLLTAQPTSALPVTPPSLAPSSEPITAGSTSAPTHVPSGIAPTHVVAPGSSLSPHAVRVSDAASTAPVPLLPLAPPPPPVNEEDPNNPYNN